jgi:hypothetical protein
MTSDEKANQDGSDLEKMAFAFNGWGRARMEGKITADSGWYAEGQAGFQSKADSAGTWERWLKVGKDNFAIRVLTPDSPDGFKKGQDVYIVGANGAPGRYEGKQMVKDRGVSIHMTLSEMMNLVTCVLYKPDGSNNAMGVRPRVEIKAGPATVVGSVEYYSVTPQDNDAKGSTTGYGLAANVEMPVSSLTLGASVGYGVKGGKDSSDKDKDDEITLSTFGYLKVKAGAGTVGLAGGLTNFVYDKAKDEKTLLDAYVSYVQNNVAGVNGLNLELGAGYSATDNKPDGGSDTTNTGMGGRVRIQYNMGANQVFPAK